MTQFKDADARRFEKLVSSAELTSNTQLALKLLQDSAMLLPHSSYLGVGAGTGQLEWWLAKEYGATVGYVDPSENLASKFRELLTLNQLEDRALEIQVSGCEEATLSHRYDFATAIHSWYYIGQSEQAVDRIFKALRPNGALGILLHREGGVMDRLLALRQKPEELVRSGPIARWLRSLDFRVQVTECQSESPLESYLNADESWSPRGREWIAYTLRQDADSISADQWDQAKRLLLEPGVVVFPYAWLKVEH